MRAFLWFPRFRPAPLRPGTVGAWRTVGIVWMGMMALAAVGATTARAQSGLVPMATATPTPPPRGGFFLFRAPQRPIVQSIPRQPPPLISQAVYDAASPDTTHVIVSLSRQRVFLYNGDQVAIDSPISSGKKGHTTPSGHFHILVKEPNHYSNIYGNFCDREGRVVRSGVSAVIDSAPAGTHFIGAPMKWFMRLTDAGVGMHIGILPGYAASHGCVRLPAEIAPLIYQKVRVGTAVTVEE